MQVSFIFFCPCSTLIAVYTYLYIFYFPFFNSEAKELLSWKEHCKVIFALAPPKLHPSEKWCKASRFPACWYYTWPYLFSYFMCVISRFNLEYIYVSKLDIRFVCEQNLWFQCTPYAFTVTMIKTLERNCITPKINEPDLRSML